jgi:hypothetical protein
MDATKLFFVVGLLVFSTVAFAQDSIPSGTILPVQLNSSLSSKDSTGQDNHREDYTRYPAIRRGENQRRGQSSRPRNRSPSS